ncbi:MAG TPA: hypothetical protein PKA88_30620, partial [Polyangiaceae bacterium]|nr:hypothetical protein [Polyangiaceae bacterium]
MTMSPLRRTSLALLLSAFALIGCDDKKPASEPAPAAVTPVASAASAAARPSAAEKSKFPPEARRNSAPKGIAESALVVGKPAPALQQLASSAG